MKKTIAIFFILLANTVLLAHAVLPHHHHGDQICITPSHCPRSTSDPGTYPADCEHEHGSGTPLANCLLKQLVVVPAGQGRLEPAILYLDHFTDCLLLQPSFQGEGQFSHLFRILPYPQEVPLFHTYIDCALALRAPPAV